MSFLVAGALWKGVFVCIGSSQHIFPVARTPCDLCLGCVASGCREKRKLWTHLSIFSGGLSRSRGLARAATHGPLWNPRHGQTQPSSDGRQPHGALESCPTSPLLLAAFCLAPLECRTTLPGGGGGVGGQFCALSPFLWPPTSCTPRGGKEGSQDGRRVCLSPWAYCRSTTKW